MRFLKDIILGQHAPGDSVLHRLDPRTKLLLTLVIMTSLFAKTAWWIFGVWTIIFVLALWQSALSPGLVLRNLRPFKWLFVIMIVLNLFYGATEGVVLIRFAGFTLYDSQVGFALLHSVRLVLFILFSALLTLTTSPLEITDALERMLKPLKRLRFPVHELTMMISIAMRFIPTILQEADRIRKAQMSRGAEFSGSLVKRIRALVPLTVPLFLSTFQRAEELAIAMEARCYDVNAQRTQFNQLSFSSLDFVLFALSFLIAVSLFLL